MVTELKPYPAYKDSGVPWLGQVPEHWELRSLGSITSTISHHGRPDLPLLSVVREKGVIPRSTMSDEENHNFVPDDLSNYKIVREGNLVVNKMKAWQGSLGIAPMDGIVSPAYFVFDIRIGDRQFAQTLLRSKVYIPFFAQASDGVRIGQWELSVVGMKRIPVVVPPLSEQAVIVRYLDHADRKVRHVIRARQQLIKLLTEQKQAVIQHAVTRGLDCDVRLKPSGVPWLGDIPEHWEVRRLKSLLGARITDGPHVTPTFVSDGVPFLSVDGIQNGDLVFETCRYVSPEDHAEFRKKTSPHRDDILLGKAASTGKIARVKVDFEFSIWSPLGLIRPDQFQVVSPFLEYALKDFSSQAQIETLCTLNTQKNISMDDIPRVLLPLPPIAEQLAIVHHIEDATTNLDLAIDAARREIDLLREYRTRLIADVVTGKLDVRDAAAHLPDEPEEQPEPLDEEPVAETSDLDAAESDGGQSEDESRDA